MAGVLVVGAGVTGCALAYTLAENGVDVTLIEKTDTIGGKTRDYGCKAVLKCQNCGVCLTGGLWKKVTKHPGIRLITNCEVRDIKAHTGRYEVFATDLNDPDVKLSINDVDSIAVCTGFESKTQHISSHLHINDYTGIITGTFLEEILLVRTKTDIFKNTPDSIAFVQCVGSRDNNESGMYCSRVCCSYSTRAAKVIRSYYPECEIVFFYMELQSVEAGDFYSGLCETGMEFIKCRPLKISGGKPAVVEYEDTAGKMTNRKFDLVVLSNGIYASADNDRLAEIFGLGRDKEGFLHTADEVIGEGAGIYVAGCARGPMKIDEAYADARAVAGRILAQRSK